MARLASGSLYQVRTWKSELGLLENYSPEETPNNTDAADTWTAISD